MGSEIKIKEQQLGELEAQRDELKKQNEQLNLENAGLRAQQEAIQTGEKIIAQLEMYFGGRVIYDFVEKTNNILAQNADLISKLPDLYKTIIKGMAIRIKIGFAISKAKDDMSYLEGSEPSFQQYKDRLIQAKEDLEHETLNSRLVILPKEKALIRTQIDELLEELDNISK